MSTYTYVLLLFNELLRTVCYGYSGAWVGACVMCGVLCSSRIHLHSSHRHAEEDVDLSAPQWDDINVVTGALKLFLRELPDPVIPCSLYQKFIDAASE